MITKPTLGCYFGVVLLALLVACGSLPTQQALTPTPTSKATFTPVVATFAPSVPLSLPTTATLPIATALPTRTPLPASLPKFPLDGYVLLFTKDNDLYFQDGDNVSIKLTHVGEKSNYPKLSDDNQKVVFSRDDGNIYSINTDGTHERIIIPNNWLDSFEAGTSKVILGFIPDSHQLLVETYICESQEFRSLCSTSIFLADTDTDYINKLADLGLSLQQNSIPRNIKVSPDGKMVAIGTMEGMDILNMDGAVIRNDILPYKPSTTAILFPSLFWLPDSSGVVVALPDTIYYSVADDRLPAHNIWLYTIDSDNAIQIPLDPPPMLDTFQVSPDGNWILYGGLSNDNSVYLGNLSDGQVQAFGHAQQSSFSWSPDSKHFIYTDLQSTLGAIDDLSNLTLTCYLVQWVDADRFTCDSVEDKSFRIRMAEIEAGAVKIFDFGFEKDVEASVFIKPK